MRTHPIRLLALAVLPLLALGALGACKKGTPVAPNGTVLTITAEPARVDLNGSSQITVIGRKPDGNPLSEDTEVFFSATLGNITPMVMTDGSGVARASFQSDGRAGTAEITASLVRGASSGGGDGGDSGGSSSAQGVNTVTVDVLVGEDNSTRPVLTVLASPDEIDIGETAVISVIARTAGAGGGTGDGGGGGAGGSPVPAGQVVRLFTSLGSIDPTAITDSQGIATAILRSGDEAGTATVTAILGSSAPATAMVTINREGAGTLRLEAVPTSVTRNNQTSIDLTATVRDEEGVLLGGAVVTFSSGGIGTFNGGANATTGSDGQVRKTLSLAPDDIPAETNSFTIRAETAGAGGDLVTDTVTINVN